MIELLRESINRVIVALVTLYLGCVGLFLLATRRVRPGISAGKVLYAVYVNACRLACKAFGKRRSGVLVSIEKEEGHCYVASVPHLIVSDQYGHSELVLLEDGRRLGPANNLHSDIRRFGEGRYSHWGSRVFFSTSDNSDPRENGRVYRYSE